MRLALELGRPFRLFKVLQEVLEAGTNSANPIAALDPYVREWNDADVGLVLGYAREWNTNAKHAPAAQAVVQSLLRLLPHARLKRCCAAQPAVLHGLLAYTERHLQRADRLLQASFLADYTLARMQLLFPEEDASDKPLPPPAPAPAPAPASAAFASQARALPSGPTGNSVVVVGRPGGYGSSDDDDDDDDEAEAPEPGPEQQTRSGKKKRAHAEVEEAPAAAAVKEVATAKASKRKATTTRAAAITTTTSTAAAAEPASPPRRSLRSCRTKG